MSSLLEVSLRSYLAVLMHLDHAKDDLLQVFHVQLLFCLFIIVASCDCKHLLAFEVLSCHILEAGSGPITELDNRRCIDQVNGVTQATLQDLGPWSQLQEQCHFFLQFLSYNIKYLSISMIVDHDLPEILPLIADQHLQLFFREVVEDL